MITIRENFTGHLSKVTKPVNLSFKPGVVLATQPYYAPNYMSIYPDHWVRSSDGAVLTCEQLFDGLSKEDSKMVLLTDYDFHGMYE